MTNRESRNESPFFNNSSLSVATKLYSKFYRLTLWYSKIERWSQQWSSPPWSSWTFTLSYKQPKNSGTTSCLDDHWTLNIVSKSIEEQHHSKLRATKDKRRTTIQFTLHRFQHIVVQDSQFKVGLTILMFLGELFPLFVMLFCNIAGQFRIFILQCSSPSNYALNCIFFLFKWSWPILSISGLYGLKKNDADYLVCWLIVYMLGFFSCYVGGVIFAVVAEYNTAVTVLLLGLIFNGSWIFINQTCKEIYRENSSTYVRFLIFNTRFLQNIILFKNDIYPPKSIKIWLIENRARLSILHFLSKDE